ncbi:MAG: S-layer homology domain-containing protein [Oscillospiraceae bacterium]
MHNTMKKSKKFLCLLLALVMAGSLLLLPAAAADTQQSGAERYPTIYVHGLMGWGEHDQIYAVTPYWGLTSDLMPYLTGKGYESYAASVGPLSSAWDRACELYAQLTGTTVDYGAAHAAEYGHARYGVTYDKPLFEGWSADKKINLVGHSFGGATIRLFLDILADGSAEEQAAAKAAGTEVSPFFQGGKADWVYSLTTLAAPHNGTTFAECCGDMTQFAAEASTAMAKLLGISDFKGVYDFQLEQFGFYRKDGETVLEALDRVLHSDFLSHNDNVFRDLTIDRALELNDDIEIQPNVYYFSYAGDKTCQSTITGERTSAVDMTPLFVPFANQMCGYYDQTTAGGFRIDKSWAPNDGLVNTVSALYPTDSAGRCLTQSGKTGYVQQDGYSNVDYQPGVWNVMPVRHYDHGNFIAGMPVPDLASQSIPALRQFYLSLMDNLSHVTTATPTPTPTPTPGTGLPFTDVPADRWSYPYIKQLYDAGVVSGTSATTFEPTANVTRAQFVTMIAGLAGADVSGYASGPFDDVQAGSWYAPYVNWAAASGIVSGTSATTFDPAAEISRQDMAVMLYNYAQQAGVQLDQTTVTPFTDESSIAAYALPAVQALHSAGVISGMPDGSFQPQATTTREQACVVLCAL